MGISKSLPIERTLFALSRPFRRNDKPFNRSSTMAEDYLITGNLVSTKGPFLTRPGDLKADFHACEYLAVIANLNGPTTFIREKSNHILIITGDGQTVSWPLTPKKPGQKREDHALLQEGFSYAQNARNQLPGSISLGVKDQ